VISERWEYECDYYPNSNEKPDSCFMGEDEMEDIPIFGDDEFNGTSYTHKINTYGSTCATFAPDISEGSSRYSIHKYILQSVSKELYDFNTSLIMQQQSEGNPFQEPSTIKSTIEGGIGVFAGKSARSDTIILKVYEF